MIKVEDGCEILSYMQEKNRNSNPVRAFVPVVPPLRAALDATPPVGLTFLSWGKYGQPYKKNSFGNLFHDWCADGRSVCDKPALDSRFRAARNQNRRLVSDGLGLTYSASLRIQSSALDSGLRSPPPLIQ
jgi:hypothetical protein